MMFKTKQIRTKEDNKEAYRTKPKSGQRSDIIQWLADTDFVVNYAERLMFEVDKPYMEDMIQELWIILSDISEERWMEIYEQDKDIPGSLHLIQFTSGVIYRSISSTTSKVYRKYLGRKQYEINLSDTTWNIYDKTNIMPRDFNEFIKLSKDT